MKLEELKLQFENQAQKVKLLQQETPNYASCPEMWGCITFATLASKNRYLKEYLETIDLNPKGAYHKFRLNGKPIEFGLSGDPRDINYRYTDTKNRVPRAMLMSLMLLVPVLCIFNR